MVLKPLRSPCARGWVGGEKVVLHNTSTFASHARSQCLCCFLPIIQCTFGAHQDVGLAQQPSPCRFVGTLLVFFVNPLEDGRLCKELTAFLSWLLNLEPQFNHVTQSPTHLVMPDKSKKDTFLSLVISRSFYFLFQKISNIDVHFHEATKTAIENL